MTEIAFFLGVDGGGTGCRALLCDAAGRELARCEGGAANVATDMEAAADNLAKLAWVTFGKAGLGQAEMDRSYAVLGLAGSNVVPTHKPIEDAVPCAHVHVTNDPDVVLTGALGDADGLIAAPGTGSFFISRLDGKVTRLGGWGFVLGDEASGAEMGRKLFTRTIHAHDGIRPHSDLSSALLAEFGNDPSRMVQFANTHDDGAPATPGDFGIYARRIVAAAESGDSLACELMQEGADWIALALRTLGYTPGTPVVLWGGLGQKYLSYLPAELAADITPPNGDAVTGAVRIGQRLANEL